jgi:hypothetical protein
MGRIEKTVFISYRRSDEPWALAVFLDLTQHGYDVFVDYDGIASGNFETVIFENIRARAHFLVLLTPTALERCSDPNDWMRFEIEAAIDNKRNIVPLMLQGFDFDTPAIAGQLTGKLEVLRKYNGLPIPKSYFRHGMERLRNKFMNVSVDAVLHLASVPAQQAATEQRDKATRAFRKLSRSNRPVRINWAAAVAGAKNICEKLRHDNFDPDVFIARPAGSAIFASLIAIELSGVSTKTDAVCKPVYVIQEVIAPDTAFESSYVLLYSWETISWFVSNELSNKPPGTKALLVGELSLGGELMSSLRKALYEKFELQVRSAVLLTNTQVFEADKYPRRPGVQFTPDYFNLVKDSTNFAFPWYEVAGTSH